MSREEETEKGMVVMRRGKGCKNGVSLYLYGDGNKGGGDKEVDD